MRRLAVVLSLCTLSACGSDSESTPAGTGGSGGAAGAGGTSGAAVMGCAPEISLRESPEDPAEPGPWPVGARTVAVDGLTVEVWYPAEPGSEAGASAKRYDLRSFLPPAEQGKIPDADNPWQDCDCYDGLPLDASHGPYPVVVFVHGTAGFRSQSLAHMTHWASRGFVVVAADHPGLYLGDMLQLNTNRDLTGDLAKLVTAIDAASGELGFLAGKLDDSRRAMVGHSAGGGAIADRGDVPGVRVLIPLAAGGVSAGSSLESTLVVGGLIDAIVPYSEQVSGYETSPAKKRLVGIDRAAHLFPTDLCWLENSSGQDIVEVAQKYQVQNAQFAALLFDCPDQQLGAEETRKIVNATTAFVLEETLHCRGGRQFEDFGQRYPDIAELRQE